MQKVYDLIHKVSDTDSSVLIQGETGTGKELVAKAIHELSPRRSSNFVAINCGGIPAGLLESELFGHVKGAFTGALNNRVGKFEAANGGTIFLDEIGDMSYELQVKLLRVLEERCIEPVGSSRRIPLDIRVISATNRDLDRDIQEGKFREDLFYRLNVIPIYLPPLRERRSDIPLLVEHFIRTFNRTKNRNIKGISPEAMEALLGYHWPGNVRELRNVTEMLVVIKGEGVIREADLPPKILSQRSWDRAIPEAEELSLPSLNHTQPEFSPTLPEGGIDLTTAVTEYEKSLILESLKRTGWVKQQAAKLLNLNRTTLVEKIKRYGLERMAVGQ
ncbi:MAG: sigma-54 interaction domain-containing protein, partial [Desulfatiglandales bacterium]